MSASGPARGTTAAVGTGPRDGPARPHRDRHLRDGRRRRERHPVHDSAAGAGHRPERPAGLPARRRAGGAGRAGLRDAGLGDAAGRRQLRLREPRPQPVSRLRRLVLAVVLALGRDGRGVVPDRAVPARHRGGARLAAAWRRRSRAAPCGWPSRFARALGGDGPQPARHQGLRAADGAADVPDLRAGRRGHRRRLQPRPHATSCRRWRRAARCRRCCPTSGRRRCAAAGTARCCPRAVLLFASFIGFDSIAQAGGEARRPARDLPLAIFIAVGVRGGVLLPVHRRRVPHRAVAVRGRRGPAPRRDRARPARRRAAAVLDGGDRGERVGGAHQGPAGDAARACRA